MRRVLLLAPLALSSLLASPALAVDVPTPATGKISFADVPLSATDGFINAAECASGTIVLRWDVDNSVTSSTAPIDSYQVYAHNSTTGHTETSPGFCPTVNGDGADAALIVAPIKTVTADVQDPMGEVEFATSTIVAAAGKTCATAADQVIVICVQALAADASKLGTARGKLVLSTTPPGAPEIVDVGSGDAALNVSWKAPTGSPLAESFVVEATFVSTMTAATDPVLVHSSARLTATSSYRLTDLVNTVNYSVRVFAFSTADNRSTASPAMPGRPEFANNFWGKYKEEGGQEQGGCGAGAAGPIALLVAAAALALARRRS